MMDEARKEKALSQTALATFKLILIIAIATHATTKIDENGMKFSLQLPQTWTNARLA